ncbi:MAG: uroporphyrinogen-III synthase [Pseudoxanthomonas sp.]
MAFNESPGWYVISLRPQGEHAALRRAAAAHGARVIALSPWKLRLHTDDAARAALRVALDAPRVLFTSPAAVRAAAALLEFHPRPNQAWIAVGSGTARALQRAGVTCIQSPARMDSEGLLELPALQDLPGIDVGLVTAPEGRSLLAATLRERGARLLRADVYAREPIALSPFALRRLRALQAPAFLALTSEGALRHVLAQAPADILARLRAAPAMAASARLQRIAREAGFNEVELAEGPRPRQLLAAMARRFR